MDPNQKGLGQKLAPVESETLKELEAEKLKAEIIRTELESEKLRAEIAQIKSPSKKN
jgi:hypothetical protein